MNNDRKLELIKLISELNGRMIVNKLEEKDNSIILSEAKKIAEALSKEGIGEFDFTSDQRFEESLNDFLAIK